MTWKVPENLRLQLPGMGIPGDPFGAFMAESPTRAGYMLLIMAAPGGVITNNITLKPIETKWDHVSIHASVNLTGTERNTTPTWEEMDYVKGLFWDPGDVVMQLHVNDGRKIDIHKYTLHLWRPTDKEIPLPPPELV